MKSILVIVFIFAVSYASLQILEGAIRIRIPEPEKIFVTEKERISITLDDVLEIIADHREVAGIPIERQPYITRYESGTEGHCKAIKEHTAKVLCMSSIGRYQVMGFNAIRLGHHSADLFDPAMNRMVARQVLEECFKKNANDYERAIMCYNGNNPDYAKPIVREVLRLALNP